MGRKDLNACQRGAGISERTAALRLRDSASSKWGKPCESNADTRVMRARFHCEHTQGGHRPLSGLAVGKLVLGSIGAPGCLMRRCEWKESRH